MSKFGLGRGLAEIQNAAGNIPDITILTGVPERVTVRQIPIVQIAPNPNQPRKIFSDTELNELASSIREHGVLQPILLRAVSGKSYSYEIIAGERRYRAAQIAGLGEIPALVKNVNNENAMEIALIENVQRENLNPIEEANAYQNLMEKCGYSLSDVARLIGKSESFIRNCLRIITLPDSVQAMVADGKISASHARTIAVAENPEELAHKIINSGLSVSDTAIAVKNAARSQKSRQISHNNTLNAGAIKEMESMVQKSRGFSIKIREKRGGAGTITISFATRQQLREIIDELSK